MKYIPFLRQWFSKNQKRIVFYTIIVFIIIISSFVKLHNLLDRSLDSDEIFSVNQVTGCHYKDLFFSLTCFDDGNPPFYFLALKTWLLIFGNSDFSARSLSVLLFVGSAFVLVIIGKRIYDLSNNNTILLLLYFSSSSILYYYYTYARAYSMLLAFSLFTFYFINLLSQQMNIKKGIWVMGISCAVLGLYSHYSFFVFFIFCCVSYLIINIKNILLLKKLLIFTVSVGILYLPWVSFFVINRGYRYDFWQTGISWPTWKGWVTYISNGWIDIYSASFINNLLSFLAVSILLFGCLFLLVRQKSTSKKFLGLFLSISVIFYSFSPLHVIFSVPRYFIFVIPFIFIIPFVIVGNKGNKLFYPVPLLLFFCWIVFSTHLYSFRPIEDWRGISEYVSKQLEPGIIIVDVYYVVPVMKYYYTGQMIITCLKEFNEYDPFSACKINAKDLKNYKNIYYVHSNWSKLNEILFNNLDRKLINQRYFSKTDLFVFH
jgi:uncharacterized membrane protein